MTIVSVIVIALLSSLVQSATGFGFSVIAMSLWPQIMPYKYAAMVTATSSIIMVSALAFKLRRHTNFKLMIYPLISSTVTSFAGVFAMMVSKDAFMRRILGLVLLLMSLFLLFLSDKIHIRQTPLNGLIAGSASGFLSGLFNLGGPPMVIYFLSATDDKMEYSATLQCYFAINGALVIALQLMMGNFNLQIAKYSGLALAGIAVGSVAGYCIFKKITFTAIRKTVYVFMMIFGVYLLIKG